MSDVTTTRAARRRQQSAIGIAAAALAGARAELAGLSRGGVSAAEADQIRRDYDEAVQAVAKAKSAEAASRSRIEQQLGPFRGSPQESFAKLDAGFPVAFFPVRIE